MSTLKTNTIKNTDDVEMYLAKAWVNFNGTGTVAIRAAGNVSSITDIAIGQYTVNFINAMPDSNYSTIASAKHVANTGWDLTVTVGYPVNNTTTGGLVCANNGSTSDADFVCVAFFR